MQLMSAKDRTEHENHLTESDIAENLTTTFNPEESAKIIKEKVGAVNSMTLEVVTELYKARGYYSSSGFRSDLVPTGTRLMTFESYLEASGLARRTAYNWLERYVPEENKLLTYEELSEKKTLEQQEKLSKQERERSLVSEYRKTGTKPAGWDRSLDYRVKKDAEAEVRQKERIEKERIEREQRAREYKERQEAVIGNATKIDSTFADAFQAAAETFVAKTEERKTWKEKIRLSDGGKEDAFMDAIIDYMETLPNDNRRIEACSNIIKICRNISVELQQAT